MVVNNLVVRPCFCGRGGIWWRGLPLASHDWPPWKWHHLPNSWIVRSATHSLYVGLCKSCCTSTRHQQKKHWGAERPAPKRSTDGPGTQDTVVLWIFQTRSKMLRFCGKRQNNAFIPVSFFPMSFCSTVNRYLPLTSEKKNALQLARCSLGKLLKNHLLGRGKFVAFLPVIAILPGPSRSTWGSRETGWDQTDWIMMEVKLDLLRKNLWNENKKCWCLVVKQQSSWKFVCHINILANFYGFFL